MKDKGGKPLKPKDEGNWTGRSFLYSFENGELIETRIGGFTFTAEQEQEIRRAFPRGYPEVKRAAFLLRMAGAVTRLATDKGEPAIDPRAARGRAEKVAELLAEAASEIRKMMKTEADLLAERLAERGHVTVTERKVLAKTAVTNEMERNIFDLAVSGDPLSLTDLVETLGKAATGFRKAAHGLALDRGQTLAGPDPASMFVAAQAAEAWREISLRQPSASIDPDSPFVKVLREVLGAAGLPALGKDAIKTAIKGPPKSRQSR